tara:strand:+ start:469 stop:627 length:159 start_codon:yes stop_codon:yes gene_type:complete
MVKSLGKYLVSMLGNMFDSRTQQEKYLAQSKDLCDLEMRMKKLHLTSGKFGL